MSTFWKDWARIVFLVLLILAIGVITKMESSLKDAEKDIRDQARLLSLHKAVFENFGIMVTPYHQNDSAEVTSAEVTCKTCGKMKFVLTVNNGWLKINE